MKRIPGREKNVELNVIPYLDMFMEAITIFAEYNMI
jgi:biopolymer transport protein ExbD